MRRSTIELTLACFLCLIISCTLNRSLPADGVGGGGGGGGGGGIPGGGGALIGVDAESGAPNVEDMLSFIPAVKKKGI